MTARYATLLVALTAAGCTSQSDRELEAVKSARSVLAEWALVERQSAHGDAPANYTEQTRHLARDQLNTAQSDLARFPQAARVLEQARTGSPDPAKLKQANSTLEPLEKRLESS